MQGMYNMRSPAVKRLMKEAQELSEPTEQYYAQPLEENLFEWHFTIRGPADTEFEAGLYHGRIVLPPEYPMKPPSIILLTPNGRFETYKKICLSISGHHPESWQPSWSIRTALLAIIGFMPTHGGGAIGSLDYPANERKVLARRSQQFKCEHCGDISGILLPVTDASEATRQEAKELAAQINFAAEKEKKGEKSETDTTATASPQSQTTQSPQVSSPQTSLQSGMLDFTRFPFPPNPFMPFPAPQQQVTTASGVPRFPLPFVSPLLPPYPNMMGNMGAVPGMPPGMPFPPGMPLPPGMPVPPWLPQAQQMSRDNGAASPASTNNINTSTTSSQNNSNQEIPVSQQSTRNPSPTSLSDTQNSPSQPQTSDQQPNQPSPQPQTSPATEVRQRRPEGSATGSSARPSPVGQNAELPARLHTQEQSGGTASLVVMVILGIAIALLLFRRLYFKLLSSSGFLG